MAGPKEEYLIWDARFQLGFSALRHMKNDEATQQIAQLDQQTKDLAASNKSLQEANAQLDEQVQDLTASSGHLKEENNSLNDRMLQLEQESTRHDQKSRLIRKQLEEKLEAQGVDFKDVLATLTWMNEVFKAERGLRGEEIQEMKSQMESLIDTTHTPRGHARDASREMSQVTTEDESMLNDEHAEQRQLAAAHQDVEVQGVLIKAQTSSTLFEDHLRYHEKVFERFKAEAAQAFVSSVDEKYRIPLMNKLDEHVEWTWQAALEEGYKMVEAEKKTERRSARLMARNF